MDPEESTVQCILNMNYLYTYILQYTLHLTPPSANGPGRGDDDRWYKMVVIIVLPVFLFSTAHENFFYQKMENGKLLFSKKGGGKKYTFRCKV